MRLSAGQCPFCQAIMFYEGACSHSVHNFTEEIYLKAVPKQVRHFLLMGEGATGDIDI